MGCIIVCFSFQSWEGLLVVSSLGLLENKASMNIHGCIRVCVNLSFNLHFIFYFVNSLV